MTSLTSQSRHQHQGANRTIYLIFRFGMPQLRTEFFSKMAQFGIDPLVSDWLFYLMVEELRKTPDPESGVDIDPDDMANYLCDGVMEVGKRRPTPKEIIEVTSVKSLVSFMDMAVVVQQICTGYGPENSDVILLTEDNCSLHTQKLWSSLLKLPRHRYNDQFVLKCLLDPKLLVTVNNPSTILENIQKAIGINFTWPNTTHIESDLRQFGFHFESLDDTRSYTRAEIGDVLKISKASASPDNFNAFLIVTDQDQGSPCSFEFKVEFSKPFKATLTGIETFFFRDPMTKLEGVWRYPSSKPGFFET